MAADYDELRTEVKESQNSTLEAVRAVGAPDARSVVREPDAEDSSEGGLAGGEIITDELTVQVVPQGSDEFLCQSCFLVRHRSQIAAEVDGQSFCLDCRG